MSDDPVNGAALLKKRVQRQLDNARLTEKARLDLELDMYMIESLVAARTQLITISESVTVLQSHDLIAKANLYPKAAGFVILGGLVLNGMINWAGIRKPLIQAFFLHVFGVALSQDVIP